MSADYNLAGFTLSAAYSTVSDGQISGGFGDGPWFTSANIKNIDGVDNQKATALGIEYLGD